MIGRLKGFVNSKAKSPILLDVHDVGYLIQIPESHLQSLVTDAPQVLYIHTHVREDLFDLYGFLSETDQIFFELLLTVSGIGPKTALTVIGKGSDAVKKAVINNDVDFFMHVPRLGKKNAQKIIIELKNKIGGLTDLNLTDTPSEMEELSDALQSMGFGKNEIQRAHEALKHSDESIDNKIRAAFKILGKGKSP